MTAVVADRASKRRVALLVVVAVVVSALAASATAVALRRRADLSSTRRRVDDTWARLLRPALDTRYRNLADASGVARNRLGAGRAVFDDIDKAVGGWPATARAATERQVAAAAELEGLAARLAATVSATPKLRSAPDVNSALDRLHSTDTTPGRSAYNAAVNAYQQARGGFPRRLVAGALGYEDRRMLEVPA